MDNELQDYFVVHEVAHLGMPAHGRLRESLLTAYPGYYRELEWRFGAQHRQPGVI